jgi:hypothetical protein
MPRPNITPGNTKIVARTQFEPDCPHTRGRERILCIAHTPSEKCDPVFYTCRDNNLPVIFGRLGLFSHPYPTRERALQHMSSIIEFHQKTDAQDGKPVRYSAGIILCDTPEELDATERWI